MRTDNKEAVILVVRIMLLCKMFNGNSTTEKLKFKLLLFNLATTDKYFA